MRILFEHALLLANRAGCVALLPEQLAQIQVCRPKQRPVPNQPVGLLAGALVVAVEAVIVEQPTVGSEVSGILLEGLVDFTRNQLLTALKEINQREDGMGAATAWVIEQRLPDFAFRLVKQAGIVRPAIQNPGDMEERILRSRGGEFGIRRQRALDHPLRLLGIGGADAPKQQRPLVVSIRL